MNTREVDREIAATSPGMVLKNEKPRKKKQEKQLERTNDNESNKTSPTTTRQEDKQIVTSTPSHCVVVGILHSLLALLSRGATLELFWGSFVYFHT